METQEIGIAAGLQDRVTQVYQGLGYMTEVLEAVFAYEFALNGLNRISGTCEVEDMASIRMMEKAGMTYEETFPDPKDKPANRRRYAIHQKEYFLQDKQD